MFLTNLFKIKPKCAHEKITPDMEFGYCPDCGKLVVNDWYISRCACCGVKLRTISRNGNIEPQNHYCSNCGSSEYFVEKLPRINFIDINFAVLIQREEENQENLYSTTQCWEEKTVLQPRLPVRYL